MQLIAMNLATNFIDTVLIFYFIKTALAAKVINKSYTAFLLTCLIILNALINTSFGLGSILGFTSILVVSTMVFAFLLSTRTIRTFLTCLIASVFMGVIEAVVTVIIIFIFDISPLIIFELTLYRALAVVTSKTIFLLLIVFVIKKINLINYIMIKEIYHVIFIVSFNIVIIFMTVLLYKHIQIESNRDYLYLFGMTLGMIIFSWSIYMIFNRIKLQNEREIIWDMKEKEYKSQEFYVKNMKDILKTIKAQRHDFNNYMSTLYGLIHLERFDESKQYITKLGKGISCMDEIIETNHPVITAIINIKRHIAANAKVDMEIFTELPEKIPVDYIDLSIILGNLLDNALEACENVKEEERVIELFMIIRSKHLIIKVANSKANNVKLCKNNILGRFTTKKDSNNHGFGLNNIQQVVDQYNGTIKIEDEGDNFKVDIALLLD